MLTGLNQINLELFESKYIPEPMSGCWIWTASLSDKGYGRFQDSGLAHRKAYLYFRGPIPDGYDLDHLCRVRCCVNPWHLESVTRRENLRRGMGFPAIYSRRTNCPRGHPYLGSNCIEEMDRGYIHRRCRICKNARQFRYNRRVRGKEVTQCP